MENNGKQNSLARDAIDKYGGKEIRGHWCTAVDAPPPEDAKITCYVADFQVKEDKISLKSNDVTIGTFDSVYSTNRSGTKLPSDESQNSSDGDLFMHDGV